MDPVSSPSEARPAPVRKPERLKAKQAKKLIVELLRKYPIIEAACVKVGISRSTHYEWIKKDAGYCLDVQEALKPGYDAVNDIAESVLIDGIKAKEYRWTTFWLEHRHPDYKKIPDAKDQPKPKQLYIKRPPDKELVEAIRMVDPTYRPPAKPEYITE